MDSCSSASRVSSDWTYAPSRNWSLAFWRSCGSVEAPSEAATTRERKREARERLMVTSEDGSILRPFGDGLKSVPGKKKGAFRPPLRIQKNESERNLERRTDLTGILPQLRPRPVFLRQRVAEAEGSQTIEVALRVLRRVRRGAARGDFAERAVRVEVLVDLEDALSIEQVEHVEGRRDRDRSDVERVTEGEVRLELGRQTPVGHGGIPTARDEVEQVRVEDVVPAVPGDRSAAAVEAAEAH